MIYRSVVQRRLRFTKGPCVPQLLRQIQRERRDLQDRLQYIVFRVPLHSVVHGSDN